MTARSAASTNSASTPAKQLPGSIKVTSVRAEASRRLRVRVHNSRISTASQCAGSHAQHVLGLAHRVEAADGGEDPRTDQRFVEAEVKDRVVELQGGPEQPSVSAR